MGYLAGHLSTSRFNRRLHALGDWLRLLLEALGAVFARGEAFLLDSLPLPVCRRVRARRCRKVRGREYCGYCAAKREKVFGWRLHLVCTLDGRAGRLRPAAGQPARPDAGPRVDRRACRRGRASTPTRRTTAPRTRPASWPTPGVRLVPQRRDNMRPNLWADKLAIREFRKRIETLNSQLEAMGLQRLRARTNAGFELKVHASLLALVCANAS